MGSSTQKGRISSHPCLYFLHTSQPKFHRLCPSKTALCDSLFRHLVI